MRFETAKISVTSAVALGLTLVQGVTAPTAADAQTITTLGSGFNAPQALAFDTSSNLYVADFSNNAIKEILAPGYTTVSTLVTGITTNPAGVAVDSSNNVYYSVFNSNPSVVKALAPGYTTLTTLASGLSGATGLAFDSSGNLFVADHANNAGAVKELLAPGYTTIATIAAFTGPTGVAIDSNGNLFVAIQDGVGGVAEVLAPGFTTINTLVSGVSVENVALDSSNNVFLAESNNNAIGELLAPGYTTLTTVASGITTPNGVAVDGSGDIFVGAGTTSGNSFVLKIVQTMATPLGAWTVALSALLMGAVAWWMPRRRKASGGTAGYAAP